MSDYQEFLARKRVAATLDGYDDDPPSHPQMFQHQIDAIGFGILGQNTHGGRGGSE